VASARSGLCVRRDPGVDDPRVERSHQIPRETQFDRAKKIERSSRSSRDVVTRRLVLAEDAPCRRGAYFTSLFVHSKFLHERELIYPKFEPRAKFRATRSAGF
jgi:hypothetical protein